MKTFTKWLEMLLGVGFVVLIVLFLACAPARAQNQRIGVGPQGVLTIFNNQICSEPTYLAGQVWCAGGPLAVLPAQTAITTITTAQTMATFTPWTGFENTVGKRLHVKVYGVYTQPAETAGGNVSVSLQIGSTTVATLTSAASSTSACTNCQFNADFDVLTTVAGTTGKVEAHGTLTINLGTTSSVSVSQFTDSNTAASSAFDLTAANAINVQFAEANATTAFTSATARLTSFEIAN